MLELFHLSQDREPRHPPPGTGGGRRNHLARIDQKVREDPEANRLFLDILCSRKDPGPDA